MDLFFRCVASLSTEASSLLSDIGVHDPTTLSHLLEKVEDASALARDYYPQLFNAEQQRVADELWRLRERTEWAARKRARDIAAADGPALAVHFEEAKKKLRAEADEACAEAAAATPRADGPDPAWPGELKRLEDASGHAVVEKRRELRAKWVLRAADLVAEAGLPLYVTAQRTRDPQSTMGLVAQGRRLATIRRRVTDWRPARAYFLAEFGTPWPKSLEQVLDYIKVRADEPCHRTTLNSFHGALAFLERGGGVPLERQLSKSPAIRAAVEETTQRLFGELSVERRQAPCWPLVALVAWERRVIDSGGKAFDRMYAWWLCVKVWGCLRFDDHRGLAPKSMRLTPKGLDALLTRTKTSGPGKKVEVLPLHVAQGAFIVEPTWLATGFALWSACSSDRGYFLCLPTEDRAGIRFVEAEYSDATHMTRALCHSLSGFKVTNGAHVPLETSLLDKTTLFYWTEHSSRATLPSWAACVGKFTSEWMDLLGRWGADRSSGYVRTHRQRAAQIQEGVAREIRESPDPHPLLDEGTLVESLQRNMVARGVDETEAALRAGALLAVADPCFAAAAPAQDMAANGSPEDAPESDAEEGHDGDGAQNGDEAAVEESGADAPDGPAAEGILLAELLGKYVVVTPKGSKRRTLHRVGECYRTPGVDYHIYEVLGDDFPEAELFDRRCGDCWALSESCSSSSSSPTSSSSSS